MNKKYNSIIIAFIALVLAIFIYHWIDYLVKNNYIVECFTSNVQDRGTPDTSHTVNLPLNTTYSCRNFCGPTARCSITGQQCTADIDCPGCQPYVPPLTPTNNCIPGENDAGKLTLGVTPTFSTLTTDIGTQAKLYTDNKFKKAPQANLGVNTWRGKFDISEKLFKERYQCDSYPNLSHYPKRYSDTGMFLEDGPLASNAYL
jgi:hypothetical protein